MKLAYVTNYDPGDIRGWSGTGYFMRKALEASGLQVAPIGPLADPLPRLFRYKQRVYKSLLSRNYLYDREPYVVEAYARQVEEVLPDLSPDVLFSPGTIPILRVQSEKPVAFWVDATFAGLLDFYPTYSNLCRETIASGHRFEQEALDRCRLALYSSEWAARTALENYRVDPAKVRVVPFGANLVNPPTADEVQRLVRTKDMATCRLLFVGAYWHRKGADVAVDIARALEASGVPTALHLAGSVPPGRLPAFVTVHRFLSKAHAEGSARLTDLFRAAHFLVLPSRADCSPIVVAEASAYGVPSIGANVGGMATMIRDGRNGQTFAPGTPAEAYAAYVARLMSAKDDYQALALSALEEYRERLNWASAAAKAADLIREFCG